MKFYTCHLLLKKQSSFLTTTILLISLFLQDELNLLSEESKTYQRFYYINIHFKA